MKTSEEKISIDNSWMTKAQLKFLQVLINEENRDKSKSEICKLAGYSEKTSLWYTAIKDRRFLKILKEMNVKIVYEKIEIPTQINGIDISWMNTEQYRLFKVLSEQDCSNKSIREICQLAGYSKGSTGVWINSIKSERFVKFIESMDIKVINEKYKKCSIIGDTDVSWMNIPQKKIFNVLVNEENRSKSRNEICRLAGYEKSTSQWYAAIKDNRFRELLKKMNVNIIYDNDQSIKYINGVDISWMTSSQVKIYQVVISEENRFKSAREICKLAGYSESSARSANAWNKSIKDQRFYELLKSIGVNAVDKSNIMPDIINNIDVSWMTIPQRKFFQVLSIEGNKNKTIKEIYELAGYKVSKNTWCKLWYDAIKDSRFRNIIESIGVKIVRRNDNYPIHSEVEYITDSQERNNYIKNDIWDMRKLKKDYPRHSHPSSFIMNFRRIENVSIRNIIKRYFASRLNNLDARTFITKLNCLVPFFNSMYNIFPDINYISELEREKHIEPIIKNLDENEILNFNGVLNEVAGMFNYMIETKSKDSPKSILINKYDKRKQNSSIPKPIPLDIKVILDNYIKDTIIPLLEQEKDTPFVQNYIWDLIIIIRYTGRRIEDICHLIAEHTDNENNKNGRNIECLKYDSDGEPMIYLDHRIAKIKKDLMITIAHLKDSRGHNIVEQAILRQIKRVKNLDPAPDGYKYLFRELKENNIVDVISYSQLSIMLKKIWEGIPLKNKDGSIYYISTHQFRHTVASEMIDAGVDIWAVKEFLGHDSVAMSERYIKIYKETVKKEFKERLQKSDAAFIKNELFEKKEDLYTSEWVKNEIIAVIEQGDGCCEHIYQIASCPHMECKICRKKKIYPRHIKAVKDTIESYTIHKNNAIELGLEHKAKEFGFIVEFYTTALKIIDKGGVFEADKHIYDIQNIT